MQPARTTKRTWTETWSRPTTTPGPTTRPKHDADGHDGDHPHGLGAFLGVGRVPFMVVWLTLFIFTGFSGLFFNRVLQVRTGGYPAWFFPLSLLGALGIGLAAVKFAARAVARLVDVGGRGASTRRELSGAVGVVASPMLDGKFGEVRVRDSARQRADRARAPGRG